MTDDDDKIKLVSAGITAPSETAPDVAGPIAVCETCGTSVGPLVAACQVAVQLTCPCGNILEAWPAQ